VTTTPPGIVLERHLHLEHRGGSLLFRRAVLGLLGLICLAALLNQVGQGRALTRRSSPIATLTVSSPDRARGGLLFTTRFTIEARKAIEHPTLVLDAGWFRGMQVNSIVPQPKDETSVGGRTVLTFARLPAGGRQDTFIGFQVDPTTLGRLKQTARLTDGGHTLLTLKRVLTVVP
jgi:hypothetical protein